MISSIDLAERRLVPDPFIRLGIKKLCAQRLRDEFASDTEKQWHRYGDFLHNLRFGPIAIETDAANAQHYEVPAAFFQYVLGPNLKYSGCYWQPDTKSLGDAEAAMLAMYCARAELIDQQRILELGCGWGSLTLWMAAHYPNSQITAVSNSNSQREFIESQCQERGLTNVQVITCDINQLELDAQFDRVVSVEMFEHMRNYQQLMDQIEHWLAPGGKLFVHIFCHRYLMYPFETEGDDNWMGRYFFTGGLMPAADTLLHFQKRLELEHRWLVDGTHYEKTANAWLENADAHKAEILKLFETVYPAAEAKRWLQRWRIFFMACAELFGYRQGSEWMVAHYLFSKAA